MRYLSTRGGEPVRAAEAIVRGISPSGGLYVPEEYPIIKAESGERGSYQATALNIMRAYLPETDE
ncbi:MAG: threonine synthase, partial [Clostridiaceae bacterium]